MEQTVSRTWLAVILCCVVWFVYSKWFAPPMPSGKSAAQQEHQAPTNATATPTVSSPNPGGFNPFLGVPNIGASTHVLENEFVRVVFSEAGAKPTSLRLKKYKSAQGKEAPEVELIPDSSQGYYLGAFSSDPKLDGALKQKFSVESKSAEELRWVYEDSDFRIQKVFRLKENYRIHHALSIQNKQSAETKDTVYVWIPVGVAKSDYNTEKPLQAWEVVSYQNEGLKRKTVDSLPGEFTLLQGNTQWLALDNRYFATALIAGEGLNPDIQSGEFQGHGGGWFRYPIQWGVQKNAFTAESEIYAGPKDYKTLEATPGLKGLIDYGTFSIFAFPLLDLLRFFYKFVHNYGIAIILLTLLVRLLFYPLSLKSFRSMKAMQNLQPQITALKEKYKDDMQRFGQEQMALFKTHKVNPAGGCLPMLVQLPVFIALYAVLGNSIELYHAPFIGWIHDLSSKDPYYVLPVLMGISMFVQQKLTPNPGMDPTQQKILLIMPVVFSFIMISLPSGLTLYIFLSTLLGILQQTLMGRDHTKSVSSVAVPSGKA